MAIYNIRTIYNTSKIILKNSLYGEEFKDCMTSFYNSFSAKYCVSLKDLKKIEINEKLLYYS